LEIEMPAEPDFHDDDMASIERIVAGGWMAMASGPAGKLLSDLAHGMHGQSGALSLVIHDTDERFTGRALTELAGRYID
jgi:hypothetical protein